MGKIMIKILNEIKSTSKKNEKIAILKKNKIKPVYLVISRYSIPGHLKYAELKNYLKLYENPEIEAFPAPREDLANIVGTAPESVIRVLSDFKEELTILSV